MLLHANIKNHCHGMLRACYVDGSFDCSHPCPQGYQQMLPAAAAVSAAAAAALPTKAISAKTNGLFDPLGPLDVDALNAAYIQKHQAALLGSHLRL